MSKLERNDLGKDFLKEVGLTNKQIGTFMKMLNDELETILNEKIKEAGFTTYNCYICKNWDSSKKTCKIPSKRHFVNNNLVPLCDSYVKDKKKEKSKEKHIKKLYKKLNEKLGQHNYWVEAKCMRKWCIDCKIRAITINQPNDQNARFADYRVLCLNCNTTQLITLSKYSRKQSLESFLLDLNARFDLL